MARMLILAMLLVGNAQAQMLIVKCVDARGSITYTTDACPPGQSLRSARTYAAAQDDHTAKTRLKEIEKQQEARKRPGAGSGPRSGGSGHHAPSERDRRKAACEAARGKAQEARGKGYPSARLIALDKTAIDACFGL